jgi:hypothetical protein
MSRQVICPAAREPELRGEAILMLENERIEAMRSPGVAGDHAGQALLVDLHAKADTPALSNARHFPGSVRHAVPKARMSSRRLTRMRTFWLAGTGQLPDIASMRS